MQSLFFIEAATKSVLRPKLTAALPLAALPLRSNFNRTRSDDACERGGNSLEARVV